MHFLQCDAPGCEHREDVEAICEDQIGMACPKCGANLLTRADFDVWSSQFVPMMAMLDELGLTTQPAPGVGGEHVSVRYHDGTTTIRNLGLAPHQEEAGE